MSLFPRIGPPAPHELATVTTRHSDETRRQWRELLERGDMERIPGTLRWRPVGKPDQE